MEKTIKALQSSVKKIQNLELDMIVFRAQKENPGIFKRAEALREYRRFLELVLRYPNEKLAPPKIVDFVWHTHILDTQKYFEDCHAVFGRYVHHAPDGSEIKYSYKSERVLKTSLLYSEHFGECLWFTSNLLFEAAKELSECCVPIGNCESAPSDCALR